jgi:hypothetical protein
MVRDECNQLPKSTAESRSDLPDQERSSENAINSLNATDSLDPRAQVAAINQIRNALPKMQSTF